eukprot:Pgem_evm1s11986
MIEERLLKTNYPEDITTTVNPTVKISKTKQISVKELVGVFVGGLAHTKFDDSRFVKKVFRLAMDGLMIETHGIDIDEDHDDFDNFDVNRIIPYLVDKDFVEKV